MIGVLYVKEGEPGYFILTKELTYLSPKKLIRISVPAGFKTDFASVPRLFRGLISINGRHRRAAVIHDYIYKSGNYPRKVADKIFFDVMTELKVNIFVRTAMFSAVRLFGWLFYKKRRT